MATGVSGSMSTNASTYIEARVSYSETYDVSTNKSSVTATLAYRRTNTYDASTYAYGTYYVKINGTNYSVYSGTFTIPANNNNWQTVGSKTVTGIEHNANGAKTISIGGNFSNTGSGTSYMDFSVSKDVALTTIPRASKPTTSAASLVLDGSGLTINTNRASSSFTHTIKVQVGSQTATYNDVGTSVTFTPTIATWMAQMDTWEKDATVTCTTYSGSTQIGSAQTCTFKMQVDTSVYKPVIGSGLELSDTNNKTAALETSGTFIKGYSNLSLTVPLRVNNTDYGDTLASAKVICGGVAQTYSLSGTSANIIFTRNALTESSLTISVTDNRGYTIASVVNLTLVNYAPIRISTVTYERSNDNGDHSETGIYVKYKVTCSVFYGSFGQSNNSIRLYSESKLATASAYDSAILQKTITSSGTGAVRFYDIEGVTTLGAYDADKQYDIKFSVQDALSSATFAAIRITEGIPVYAWGEDHFDVYGKFHVHDRQNISDFIEIDAYGGGLSGILKTQDFTSASVSCTANNAGSVSVPVTVPSGYKFIGIIQTWSNGSVVPCYSNSSSISNGAVTVWWRNPTSSAMNATFTVNCLFIRI